MIKSSKEAEFSLKQEGHHHHQSVTISDHDQKAKASASSSTSTAQWPRLKDPRIVRVSRAFGGKDRHSKVCTIRGLRDRRVRLSVPTAIQLYDLQDRLGLNQPSKVVDWLLNAAKHEIDELPPLPSIPPLNSFTLYPPSLANEVTTSLPGEFNINNQNSVWKLSSKAKEVSSGEVMVSEEDKLPIRGNQNQNQNQNHASFLGLLNTMPFGYQWEQNSGEHVSQFNNQTDSVHGNSINVLPFPSNLSLSTGNNNSHQILVCPPPHHGATHSYFPSHVGVMDMDHQRQISQYQMMNSGSQNLLVNSLNPSFGLAMMTAPNKRSESQSQKDQDFPSK